MKLSALKFDNPNNAAISLMVLAEKVRTGELKAIQVSTMLVPDAITSVMVVSFSEPQKR